MNYDFNISAINPNYGPFRVGDIPHSHASIKKAATIIDYKPKYETRHGLKLTANWYIENLKQ
jgi:UDP-N-acetylglucosamine 4-epimerase